MAFIFTDSLGSTVVTRYQLGNVYRNGYYPIGEERYSTSSTPYLFTGQRNESVIGLYDYLARFYGLSSIGYRTSMNDNSGSTAWEYDLRGRLIHEIKSIRDPLGDDPLGMYHAFYAYRPDDQIKQMVLPNGEALDFDHLAQGALNAVSSDHWESGSITTIDYLNETQYDEAGRVVSRTMGNDVSQIYDFNDWETAGGRLDSFTTGSSIDPLLNIAYGYDEVGNITGLTYSSDNLMETRIYEYDQLSRLTEVAIGRQPAETITYNPTSGNIYSKGTEVYGYDSYQPHAVRTLGSQETYSYDANGNMDSKTVGGTTYTMGYDSENRMTTITGGSLTARYVFDGDGRRVLSVVGDISTLYVNEYFEVTMENGTKVNQDLTIVPVDICENRYCVFIPLAINDIEAIGMQHGNFGTTTFITEIMEPDNANVTWRIYYPGGGLRVQTTSTKNLSFMVQDHINSTAMILNNSGAVTGEVIYSAWGEVRNSYGSTPTKKLYTGQYEAEAGLYFYNARWYDIQLGRFVQGDSIIPEPVSPQSWDRYAYVNNNPIRFNDPSGHNVDCGIGESGCRQRIKVEKAEGLLSQIIKNNNYSNWDNLTKKEQKTLLDIGWDSDTFNMSDYAISSLTDICAFR
ncbi:MAG: hypothetical protein BGO78_14400 [Chloroflexi bacterium 44-23]|nr:MAG: hypothetical protein BGO78_14400 [Chloroflexi bacterium 44-23]